MRKTKLLNSEISYEISKIGHTEHICICDAGLPIPLNVKRIDLAIEKNIPDFITVLRGVLYEIQVEEVVLANEIKEANPKMLEAIKELLKENNLENIKISYVTHTDFKKETNNSRAIIRTGECTPYANILLISGVVFRSKNE